MSTAHLFPAANVKYAAGQRILVTAGSAATFTVADYFPNLIGVASDVYIFDWGDGEITSTAGGTASVAHTYASPTLYDASLQVVSKGNRRNNADYVPSLEKILKTPQGKLPAPEFNLPELYKPKHVK